MVNKKLVAAGVVMSMVASSLVGCGGSSEEGNGGDSAQIYFLNFKPWSKKSDQTTKPNPPKIINSIIVDSTIQSL